MNSHDQIRLRHMLDAAREGLSFAKNRTIEDLTRDRMFLLAAVKEIEIIGEAASRISEETRKEFPGVQWTKVVGIRNRLIHAYADIDLSIIWATLTVALPELVRELEKAVANHGTGPV